MNTDVIDLMKTVKNYFFSGRLNRIGYLIRLSMTLGALFLEGDIISNYYNSFLINNYGFYLLLLALMMISVVYFFSIATRRLHDIGLSGSYLLILAVVWFIIWPLTSLYNPETSQRPSTSTIIGYAVALSLSIGLFFLILKKGSVKSNQYGVAP